MKEERVRQRVCMASSRLLSRISRRMSTQVKRTSAMEWSASPSPSVIRKRLEQVGPVEAGRVTSVVQYLANSEFPKHEHPDGEEILVLEGVFSDDSGDYPKGMYILNPEGFAHAPRSKDGCTLLVKLKQYSGLDRRKVRVNSSDSSTWTKLSDSVSCCSLYAPQEGESYPETMDLIRISTNEAKDGFTLPPQPNGLELFVIQGELEVSGAHAENLESGSWLKMLSSTENLFFSSAPPHSETLFYLKKGHLFPDQNTSEP